MLTKIIGRHMEITEAMRAQVEKKIARLSKYHDRISTIEVVVDREGKVYKTEIIIKVDRHENFVVNYAHEDAYACLDSAIDKMERQLTRHKEKTRNHKGHTSAAGTSGNLGPTPEIPET